MKLFIAFLVVAACGHSLLRGQGGADSRPSGTVNSSGEIQSTGLKGLAKQGMAALDKAVDEGKRKLTQLVSGQSAVEAGLSDLQGVVCAATERVKRLSQWNVKEVGEAAQKRFDETISVLSEYLQLVKDDGVLHEAAKRIRRASEDKAREFREKAGGADQEENRAVYKDMADAMEDQANRVDEVWQELRRERTAAESSLTRLKSKKQLYLDLVAAKAIQAAVKELEKVRDDLKTLTRAMENVQVAVLSEAKGVKKQ